MRAANGVVMKNPPGNMMAGAMLAAALATGTPDMVAAVEAPAVVQQAGANFVAAVPQSRDTTFGIGANSPRWDAKDGDGAWVFALAAAGFASVIVRNGSNGLTPATGGWDANKDNRIGRTAIAPRTTPDGIEKVRFPPTMGGPERPAAGQQGVGLLLAGFLPTILEISRVMALPSA